MREHIARLKRSARNRKIWSAVSAGMAAIVVVLCFAMGLRGMYPLGCFVVWGAAAYIRFEAMAVEERLLGVLEKYAPLGGPAASQP